MGLFLLTHHTQAQKVYGYYTIADSIYFEFQQKDYPYVISTDEEYKIPINLISFYEVIFVGGIQQQNNHRYQMQQVDSISYRISFPINSLGQLDWTFNFLINGSYWVEPPEHALNRVQLPDEKHYSFTTLFQQETFLHLALDTAALEDAMHLWLQQQGTYITDTSSAGLQPIRKVLSTGKVVGIGRAGYDSLATFPVRFGLTKFLMSEMDFQLVAFEINRRTDKQVRDYLSGDSISFNDGYIVEMINIIEWKHFHENTSIQDKLRYMIYQEEDVLASLQVLHAFASKTNTDLQQKIDTLTKEISSLLNLQQIMGLYYYESPSYQRYLMELLFDISEGVNELVINTKDKAKYRVDHALSEIKNYLSQLQDLKGYYQNVENQIAQYFNWMEDLQMHMKFLVWVDNLEVSKSRPGTVGHYLSQKYGQKYIAIGIGAYDFAHFTQDSTGFSLELPFVDELKEKAKGTQAFVIDLREKNLTPEEENWLAAKVFPREDKSFPYAGKLQEEFDVIILVDE